MAEKTERNPRLSPEIRAQIELRDEIERMHNASDARDIFNHARRVCALISLIPLNSYVEIVVGPNAFKDVNLKKSKFARMERPYIATYRFVNVEKQIGESQLTARASWGENPQIVFQEFSTGNIGSEMTIDTSDLLSARIVKPQPSPVKPLSSSASQQT